MDLSNMTMYQACLLHSRAERVLKNIVNQHLEKYKMNRMEWLVLATADQPARNEAGHTMGEIAKLLDIRLSQLTALVNSMNISGLLEQTIDLRDRRTKYTKASVEGRKRLRQIEEEMREAMKHWLAGIPRENLGAYLSVIDELADTR